MSELEDKLQDYQDTVEAMLRAAMPNGEAMTIDELEAEADKYGNKPSKYIAALRADRNALENAVRKLLQCGPPFFDSFDERAWDNARSVALRALERK